MPRIARVLAALPEALCAVLALVMPLLVGLSVLARYSELFVVTWAEELMGPVFTWMSFLGASVAVKRRAHFRLLVFVHRLPPVMRCALEMTSHLSLLALGLVFVVLGSSMVGMSMRQLSPILQIPRGVVYLVVPVSGALVCVYSARYLLETVRAGMPEPTIEVVGSDERAGL